MLWFNDQVLSRANHELATLQMAILRTKPTFALKPQIINAVKEGQLYLSADQIDQDESGRMTGVTIFDVSDGARRRSIYADSGKLSFAVEQARPHRASVQGHDDVGADGQADAAQPHLLPAGHSESPRRRELDRHRQRRHHAEGRA